LSPLIVLVYPFAKRFTSWPQAILGFAFAYGALLGWTAQTGSLGWPAVWLYLAAIFWTIGFDTIYALQDKRDDSIAGVRSTALLFGERVRLAVGALYLCSAALAQLAVSAAHAGGATQIGVEIGVLAYAAHLAWQVARTDAKIAPSVALMLFRSNRDAGLLLFAGFAAQGFLSAYS
ncbi:MAG: 4-hydroxybenzoate octaprenyltransferase, partial [Methylocystaceae bacterium]